MISDAMFGKGVVTKWNIVLLIFVLQNLFSACFIEKEWWLSFLVILIAQNDWKRLPCKSSFSNFAKSVYF